MMAQPRSVGIDVLSYFLCNTSVITYWQHTELKVDLSRCFSDFSNRWVSKRQVTNIATSSVLSALLILCVYTISLLLFLDL